jgi:hypothetical protein
MADRGPVLHWRGVLSEPLSDDDPMLQFRAIFQWAVFVWRDRWPIDAERDEDIRYDYFADHREQHHD